MKCTRGLSRSVRFVFVGTNLQEEEQRGECAGGPVGGAVGAGVALDVVIPGGAVGELALWGGGRSVLGGGARLVDRPEGSGGGRMKFDKEGRRTHGCTYPEDGRHEREEGDHDRDAQDEADGERHLAPVKHVVGASDVGDVEECCKHRIEPHIGRARYYKAANCEAEHKDLLGCDLGRGGMW